MIPYEGRVSILGTARSQLQGCAAVWVVGARVVTCCHVLSRSRTLRGRPASVGRHFLDTSWTGSRARNKFATSSQQVRNAREREPPMR
eukprot:3306940-Prymnesium_polylepis.1